MREELMDISALSDSKEILLTKPNSLVAIFTAIITLMLGIAFLWMYYSNMDVYVKAAGMVRSNEAASTVRVQYGGKAIGVNVTEGQHVEKGDVLLSFDQQSLHFQIETNNKDIEDVEAGVELLRLYRDSIESLSNRFEGMDDDKAKAYGLKVEAFLLERKTSLTQVAESVNDLDKQKKTVEIKLTNATDTLAQLLAEQTWVQRYKQSVETGRDMISLETGDSAFKTTYLSMYQKYAVGLETSEKELGVMNDNLDRVTTLYDMGEATKKDVEDAQNVITEMNGKITAYRQSEITSASAKAAEMEMSITNAKSTIKTAEQELGLYSGSKTSPLMQVEQSKINLLAQIDAEIEKGADNVAKLKANIESLNLQINDSRVIAPISGIVNLASEINEGDIIPQGSEIGAILPPDSESFKVTLQVGNRDISGVKLDQLVKLKFLALPYQEYGMVDATINYISPDARVSQQGESYYIVEAALENKPIKSYKGQDENIKVGMAVEGRLISGQKTIWRWFLEKLDFAS